MMTGDLIICFRFGFMQFFLTLIAVFLVMGLVSGCGDDGASHGSTSNTARSLPAWVVQQAPDEITRKFPGVVAASDFVMLSFEVNGRLTEFPVREAQELQAGDLIARLDKRDFQNRVYAAKARVAANEAKLKRVNAAFERNAASEVEVIEQRAARDSAVAQLKISEKALEDTEIRAPYDGIVADKIADTFSDVESGDGIVLFGAIEEIKIVISLPEQDVVHVNELDPGRFIATFDTLPGRKFPLTYKEATVQADLVTQTYEVTFTTRAPDDVNILPGMTTQVSWTRDVDEKRESPLLIPAASLFVTPEGESSVWLVDPDDGTVTLRKVRTETYTSEGLISVIEGLEVNQIIAAAGIHSLREGMKVRPTLTASQHSSHKRESEPSR